MDEILSIEKFLICNDNNNEKGGNIFMTSAVQFVTSRTNLTSNLRSTFLIHADLVIICFLTTTLFFTVDFQTDLTNL